jgi:uncharacterized membrane protein YadS
MTIESVKSKGAGVALIGALALVSLALTQLPLIQKSGLSALTLAIVLQLPTCRCARRSPFPGSR